jgi:hypothetical protein
VVVECCGSSPGAYVGRDGTLFDEVFLQTMLINHVAICCTENKAANSVQKPDREVPSIGGWRVGNLSDWIKKGRRSQRK